MKVLKGTWVKRGLIYRPYNESESWFDHAMAPAAFLLDDSIIRILVGGWDKYGISRIYNIDVEVNNPKRIINVGKEPILDIGIDGCFDDNGVFPGHVYRIDDKKVFLYYTGFQKLCKIDFYNFSGLAISNDGGLTFQKISNVPVLDRSEEGLYTRAGISTIFEDDIYKCCYSAGSNWMFIAGKQRPVYEIYYIESQDGINFSRKGCKIVECDFKVEHGLGRPQIFKIDEIYYVFYTRRMINFKYFMGVAYSLDLKVWIRIDEWMETIEFGKNDEFDSEMVYFPCVINTGKNIFLFYVGNGYGKTGIGYAELII